MDLWASLEHELAYKTEAVTRELKDCADVITTTDLRMQHLYNSCYAALLVPLTGMGFGFVP